MNAIVARVRTALKALVSDWQTGRDVVRYAIMARAGVDTDDASEIPRCVESFLLPEERKCIVLRRHWAITLLPFSCTFGITSIVLGVLLAAKAVSYFTAGLSVILVAPLVVIYSGHKMVRRLDLYFVVTDRRIALFDASTQTAAVVPLTAAVELVYRRTLVGWLLGYCHLHIAAAETLDFPTKVGYLPHPLQLFHDIESLLFFEPESEWWESESIDTVE